MRTSDCGEIGKGRDIWRDCACGSSPRWQAWTRVGMRRPPGSISEDMVEERKQDVSAQADPVREQGGETDICKSFAANHRPIPLPRLGRAAVAGRLFHVLATRARARRTGAGGYLRAAALFGQRRVNLRFDTTLVLGLPLVRHKASHPSPRNLLLTFWDTGSRSSYGSSGTPHRRHNMPLPAQTLRACTSARPGFWS